MRITDEQWDIIKPHLPIRLDRKDNRGRPRISDRAIFEGILWVLKTGARWKDLPKKEYPPYQTCHRRFQEWTRINVFSKTLTTLAQDMEQRGMINLKESFIDGTFSRAKKGAKTLEKQSVVRGQRSWQYQTLMVFLSPSIWPLLLRMKSHWWRKRLPIDLQKRLQEYLLVTGPMTPIPWIKS